MSPRKDITGQRFGKLIVISINSGGRNSRWNCKCDCGNFKVISRCHLSDGHTKSCGCIQKELQKERMTKQFFSKTAEYRAWSAARNRCLNPKHPKYNDYGGRGITMCDRWCDSFENFFTDMGRRPSSEHSIDRINNDGNYEPGNCRWATRTLQMINRRPSCTNNSGCSGVYFCTKTNKWSSGICINKNKIFLGYFLALQDAIAARKEAEKKYFNY